MGVYWPFSDTHLSYHIVDILLTYFYYIQVTSPLPPVKSQSAMFQSTMVDITTLWKSNTTIVSKSPFRTIISAAPRTSWGLQRDFPAAMMTLQGRSSDPRLRGTAAARETWTSHAWQRALWCWRIGILNCWPRVAWFLDAAALPDTKNDGFTWTRWDLTGIWFGYHGMFFRTQWDTMWF